MDKLNESLDQSLFESDISIIQGVCVYLALPKLQMAFKQLKHHGTEFKKNNKRRLQEPKDPDRDYYRNVSMQNEWIEATILTQWVITSFVISSSSKC